jgi:putative N6-adenine-specific DNA methylase
MSESRVAFAVAAPGLSPVLEAEARAVGLAVLGADDAGVRFVGDPASVRRANLHLRTATRVLVRLAAFEARGFPELERRAKQVAWSTWLPSGTAVRLRVTSKKSKLYHTAAIAERLEQVLAGHGVVVHRGVVAADDDDEAPDAIEQLLVVRVYRDGVTISADASGALLHRRGWRLATAKAPMRETLAAALLLSSGWPRHVPLVDPMAGSGTIGIEAALLARGLAPGLHRRFAFEHWPEHDAAAWARERDAVQAAAAPRVSAPIVVNDRDAGAVDAIRANAERAGVLGDLDIRCGPASALEFPEGRGWIVSNPPYGKRVTGGADLRDLYAALGRAWARRAPGWHLSLVCEGPAMLRGFGVALTPTVTTRNGGLAIAFGNGVIPEES